MAVDSKSVVHLVWPTLVADGKNGDPTIGIFYSSTADGSRFGEREAIPTAGVPHHPRIVVSTDGTLVAAWDESGDGTRRIALARGDAGGGKARFRREVISSAEAAVYPAMAITGDAAIVVWTSGASESSSIRIHRLPMAAAGSH